MSEKVEPFVKFLNENYATEKCEKEYTHEGFVWHISRCCKHLINTTKGIIYLGSAVCDKCNEKAIKKYGKPIYSQTKGL